MKYFLLLLFTIVFNISYSQTVPFEGNMTWNIVVDILDVNATDKYKKEILKEDNSEIDETILELEQQLNDPEMQYLLLENPTIKSTMQKKLRELKDIRSANQYNFDNAFFPNSLQMYLKNNNSFTRIDGGSISKLTGNMLYLYNTATTYFIKDATKTYSSVTDSAVINSSDHLVSLTRTTDTLIILNYTCIKYILITEENNTIETSYFWVTSELSTMNHDAFRALGFATGNLHHEAFKQVHGIPLRIEYIENGFKFKMEVSDITPKLLSDSYFILPTEYKMTNFGF
ncbi:DUF4412 domain-containing protein [Cytophaga aurantiaca]|uniref:DUF4412 domain-containing protein n=1 Tax=Cytophaga aurantiaca TaxID=29530 RepID=UPI000525E178|nr:DUF4412 domain-containing protein [Cytophaga aurantiaca]